MTAANDPFGMSNFSMGPGAALPLVKVECSSVKFGFGNSSIFKDPFSSGPTFGNTDFSLDELDPLKK